MAKSPRSPQGDLRFEFGAPAQQPGGTYAVAAKATAFLGNQPQAGIAVSFDAGGVIQVTSGTDSVGEAFATLTLSGVGTHWIGASANIGGKPCRASRQIMIQASATASVKDKFSARLSVGGDGIAVVSVLVADTEGDPISKVLLVFVYDGRVYPNQTDAQGRFAWDVPAGGPGMIQVQCPGFETEELFLDRPRFTAPNPPAGLTWWQQITRGWSDGGRDLRNRRKS